MVVSPKVLREDGAVLPLNLNVLDFWALHEHPTIPIAARFQIGNPTIFVWGSGGFFVCLKQVKKKNKMEVQSTKR